MKRNHRFKLSWTKIDIIIVSFVFSIATILSCFIFFLPKNNENADVYVYYDGEIVISLPLKDEETDGRYVILFKNEETNQYDEQYPTNYKFSNKTLLLADLIIEIKEEHVQIIKETSPNNICSKQGAISRPNTPLTCAPNYVSVIIKTPKAGDEVIPI